MATTTEPRDILLQGIIEKWDATGTLNTIPIRQGDRAADARANPASGTFYPYVSILKDDRSSRYATTCGNDYWRHTVRFRVYQTSEDLCADAAKLINDVFRARSLSLTLAAGGLVKNQYEDVIYREESKGVHYAELRYEFETSFPVQA